MADDTPPAKLLLVEGSTDYHVMLHLRERMPPMPEFCINARGSVDKVLDAVTVEIDSEQRTALGIIVDADDAWRGRWAQICHRLLSAGIPRDEIPGSPDPTGIIIDGILRKPRVGVWMMPNNQSDGELEDFLFEMLPARDPVWPMARNYIDGIEDAHRKFNQGKTLRAQIHAWLAAREEPRLPGLAIRTGDLNTTGDLCTVFVDWLRRLFS